ncbi:unnamed protein product [Paramecium primaurelia]|uniref:TLDc domain-containing protein n=1 Tax=Paramecium primaurelia TaxID=5886 RepID=A0A8S1NI06_PARPR|nr:unnamed protein product [Paramecium primaurelia]
MQLYFEQTLHLQIKLLYLQNIFDFRKLTFSIFYILQEKTKKIIKGSVEMYLGSRDGLKAEYFWQKVNNKDNLLMIFKSKSGSIFGAYSPCKWVTNGQIIADNTLTSFIFSQTHDQIYNLKEDKKYAIYCKSDFGPSYGYYNDIDIKGDFTDGHSNLGEDYEFDRDKNKNYQIFSVQINLLLDLFLIKIRQDAKKLNKQFKQHLLQQFYFLAFKNKQF